MRSFRLMRYLKKILPLILSVCILATVAINYKLRSSNTYIASEVIHYNDAMAEQGYTPTGAKLDVNEIKSSFVMSKVVSNMGLTGIYSIDSLTSRVIITPLPDEDKLAQKEAKLEEGEEYVYEPSTYIVSFVATNKEGPDFARTVLNGILDVYFAEYSQKYINVAPAKNVIENIQSNGYDYIEMLELIEKGIEETLETLYLRMEQTPLYRATSTGTSFDDLSEDFFYIKYVELADLYAKVFKHQLTKNKLLLIADYTTRINNNTISKNAEEKVIGDTLDVIDAYVKKMRDSGNTNINFEYILDTVHEKNLLDTSGNPVAIGDQTVTYDELIYSWRNRNENKAFLLIDNDYCRYVIDIFQKCTGLCENEECQSSALTCSQINDQTYTDIQKEIEKEIASLVKRLTELYRVTMETNEEYNAYLGARYISVLATTSVQPSVNVTLYTLIAFVFLIVLCCCGAIVIGRLGDILHYVFYTDHLTDLNNRAYFDEYLRSMDKKLLDDGTVYCIVEIANLITINTEHSRQVGDEIIRMFSVFLKETFGKTNAEMIYNGNGCFVVLAKRADYTVVEDIMRLFGLQIADRNEHRNVKIVYRIGIAETVEENRSARKLLAKAIGNKKEYFCDAESR